MTTYYTKVRHDGNFYNGYLPAIGQFLYISKNVDKVNVALKALEIDELFEVNDVSKGISGYWWSSSECNCSDAWYLRDGVTYNTYKVFNYRIFPLFVL